MFFIVFKTSREVDKGFVVLLMFNILLTQEDPPLNILRLQLNRILKHLNSLLVILQHEIRTPHVIKGGIVLRIYLQGFLEVFNPILEVSLDAIDVSKVVAAFWVLRVGLEGFFVVHY